MFPTPNANTHNVLGKFQTDKDSSKFAYLAKYRTLTPNNVYGSFGNVSIV